MRDLKVLAAELLAHPVCPTPPVEQLAARAELLRLRRRGLTATGLLLVAALLTLALQPAQDHDAQRVRVVDDDGTTTTTLAGSDIAGVAARPGGGATRSGLAGLTEGGGGGSTTSAPGAGAPPPAARGGQKPTTSTTAASGTPVEGRCDGSGATTDVGVTADRIKVVTYVSSSNPEMAAGIQAVFGRVNRAGGICGRKLELKATLPQSSEHPLSEFFAVAAPQVHDSLHRALAQGEIDRLGIPVVGGAGGPPAQFASRWAWPVGPSTDDAVRAMVKHAWEAGARSFALVHDANELHGDASAAFDAAVRAVTGAPPKAVLKLTPAAPGYRNEVRQFTGQCDCDFVGLALLYESARAWVRSVQDEKAEEKAYGRKATAVGPSLFTERFVQECSSAGCRNLELWKGFLPVVKGAGGSGDPKRYHDEVTGVSPTVDVTDPLVQGQYLGAELFVQALEQVGGNLTRARLRAVLDELTFRSSMVTDLRWGPSVPSGRVANRAFRVTGSRVPGAGDKWHTP